MHEPALERVDGAEPQAASRVARDDEMRGSQPLKSSSTPTSHEGRPGGADLASDFGQPTQISTSAAPPLGATLLPTDKSAYYLESQLLAKDT